ncbi:MAG: PAS domain-containing protein [Alphaproteobacteria bacterium]|nr:PAS domain-containing protein [Alphaproteobacteria bacterium]
MASSTLSQSQPLRDPTFDRVVVESIETAAAFDTDILGRLFTYWRGKMRDGRLPARAALDPIEIPSLLPYVILIDIRRDPFDLVYRLAGTAVVSRLGFEVRGLSVKALPISEAETLFEAYGRTARDCQPRRITAQLRTHDDRHLKIERLVMPLAADGITPDMLFIGAVYDET